MANVDTKKYYLPLRSVVEGGLLVAMAEILGYIKLYRFPYGGSVTLMMLPIIVFALRWGVSKGLLAGLALGILDFMLDGGIAIGWQSILGDYVIACTLIGLAGFGKRLRGMTGAVVGTVLGCLGRFLSLWVTGAVVWGEYMPEEFLGLPMSNEWVYSFLYQLATVGIASVVTLIVVLLLMATPAKKLLLGEDLR